MFSDFKQHVIGVPQVSPLVSNVTFDGPGLNEDFGLEQVTGDPNDRYMFRTAPLRNAAVMPAYMHNGPSSTWRTLSAITSTRIPPGGITTHTTLI